MEAWCKTKTSKPKAKAWGKPKTLEAKATA
jgi:hypothetical protein